MGNLELINKALDDIQYPAHPKGLYEPIKYELSLGGKRVRPVLTLLAYQLYRTDIQRVIPAALAIEIYHNHTLLHDDLMDNADVRRGKPTVHKVWNENTAVLSGDTMLIQACQTMLRTETDNMPALMEIFLRAQQEICEGQQEDVNFETRTDVTVAEYIEMIRQKTSVLLALSLRTGAFVAGADEDDQKLLYRFGELIGLAFQLQDDYLDCYGDPKVFGKEIGGDIRQGKKTFMQIAALRRATEEEREIMLEVRDFQQVIDIYNRYGIPELAQQNIAHHYDEARKIWEQLNVPTDKKQALWDYAESMLGRKN